MRRLSMANPQELAEANIKLREENEEMKAQLAEARSLVSGLLDWAKLVRDFDRYDFTSLNERAEQFLKQLGDG